MDEWKHFLFFFCLLAPVVWSKSLESIPSADPERGTPFIRNYDPKEYGGGVQNWSAVQDPRGVMYFGNNGGVLEYDGAHWTSIPISSVPRSLAVDANGRVYVGAQGDFGFLEPDSIGRLVYRSLIDKVPLASRDFADIWKIHVNEKGVYFQSFSKLFFYQPSTQTIVVFSPTTAFHFSFMVDGTLYLTLRKTGLVQLEGDSMKVIPGGELFADLRTYAMLQMTGRSILIATREKGLFRYDGSTIRPFETDVDSLLLASQIYHGTELADGTFAFATLRGGVIRIDESGKLVERIDKASGLQDENVYFLFFDRQQGLWMCLDRGLSRAECLSPLTLYDEQSGLRGSVSGVIRHEGHLYAATWFGVYVLQAGTDKLQSKFEPVSGITTQCWSFVPIGHRLLVGSADGLYLIENKKARPFLEHVTAPFVYRSRRDTTLIYVGLRDGLAILRYRDGLLTFQGRVPGVIEEIRTIVEDREGDVWLGTWYQGLIRLTPDNKGNDWKIQKYDGTGGLPSGQIFSYETSSGPVFSAHGGIFRFNHSEEMFHPWKLGDKTIDVSSLSKLYEDADYNLWIRYTFSGKNYTAIGKKTEGDGYSLEPRALMRVRDHSILFFYSEKDDCMWLGGPNGLLRYHPGPIRPADSIFNALIRKVLILPDSLLYAGALFTDRPPKPKIEYDKNAIRFEFAATSFDLESANEYQFMLEGFDSDWSAWTSESKKDYTNLSEGDYAFRLRARNAHDKMSREDLVRFVILTPWFRSWWAYLLYLVAFGTCSFGLVRIRETKLRRDKLQLENEVQDRTKELIRLNEIKNEYLGIVAHDLRNPISLVIGYADLVRQDLKEGEIERATQDIEQINKVSRHMNHFVSELLDITAIESGKVRLEETRFDIADAIAEASYLHRRNADQKGIKLEIPASPSGTQIVGDRAKIMSVVDNLVSNAVKYTHSGGLVQLSVERNDSTIAVHVKDTGQGLSDDDLKDVFKSFKRLSAQPTGGEISTGLGLAIVKKIVEIHGGQVGVKSKLGEGSTFSFYLPRPQNTA